MLKIRSFKLSITVNSNRLLFPARKHTFTADLATLLEAFKAYISTYVSKLYVPFGSLLELMNENSFSGSGVVLSE